MNKLRIRAPDDFHLHLRRGELLAEVIPHTVRDFARALVMPNTSPQKIFTGADASTYREEIMHIASHSPGGEQFTPLMTIYLTAATTPEMIGEAARAGVVAAKLYPDGVTTNSQSGITDIKALFPVFKEMERSNMVLCVHGEVGDHRIEGLERELHFLPILEEIAHGFPGLRIVLEHVSTARAVKCVMNLGENVAATITAHHLVLTLDDVIGYSQASEGKMQPHHFCKPVAKFQEDRRALRLAATSGNPKFFFGSDSAPHPKHTKETAEVCAGISTAPVALPVLAKVFDEERKRDRLDAFTSEFGARFYGLPLNEGTITLQKESWIVPERYGSVVPFYACQCLPWRVVSRK